MPGSDASQVTADVAAVIIAVAGGEPQVLGIDPGGTEDPSDPADAAARLDALPSGPLQPGHQTPQAGLRAWVEWQTR